MKIFGGTLLIFLILAQTFSKGLVALDFMINKDFIAKTLCVNKNKPQMHCNGKCHLKKMMEKEDKQTTVQNEKETILYLEQVNNFTTISTSREDKYSFPKNDKRLSTINLPFFHPPSA